MEPVFIYYDKVDFQNNYKVFKVDFSDGDNLQGVFFRKNRDYHITSMSSFITLTQDLKELAHYDDIKKISEISNKILKNGIEHLYEEKILEANFEGVVKYEFQPKKSNRGLSVHAVEFFDEVTKRKRLVYVYSPYKELKNCDLKFQKKQKGNINGYTIDMIEENNKIYLQKELFFDKTRVINEIIKENDRKNVIFFKYNVDGEIYAMKLEITKNYYRELKKKKQY